MTRGREGLDGGYKLVVLEKMTKGTPYDVTAMIVSFGIAYTFNMTIHKIHM